MIGYSGSQTKTYCFNCMQEVDTDGLVCPHCQYDNATRDNGPGCLPAILINQRYLVGRMIGKGGFGITYIGRNLQSGQVVAIKEYYPVQHVTREHDSCSVTPHAEEDSEKIFAKGKKYALLEAKRGQELGSIPGVCPVYDFFEDNNTVYLVMEYIEGVTLGNYLQQRGGKLSFREALALLEPAMIALHEVHKRGVVHRDISPDNIMISAADNKPILLDFGASREIAHEDTQHSYSTSSILIKESYSPPEQYRKSTAFDPRTDEYAFCATLYRVITGVKPICSMERVLGEEFPTPRSLGADITPAQEQVLLKGMSLNTEERYANMEDLLKAFRGESNPDAPEEKTDPWKTDKEEATKEPARKQKILSKRIIIIAGIGLAVLLIAFIVLSSKQGGAPTATPTLAPTEAPTATPTNAPTNTPTKTPTATPTKAPTATPTTAPTNTPSKAPTATPTKAPTATPTLAPTATPTAAPTEPVVIDETWACSQGHVNTKATSYCKECGEGSDGSWLCSQGHRNQKDDPYCGECGEDRNGSWVCSLGHENTKDDNICQVCYEGRDGSWVCTQGHMNTKEEAFCGDCGEDKGSWVCTQGHMNTKEEAFCGECGEPRGGI